jgi:hypothetical protein
MNIERPSHGVIPTFDGDDNVQPPAMEQSYKGIPLTKPFPQLKHYTQFTQIKVFCSETQTSEQSPPCFCNTRKCSQLCIAILTDEERRLNFHAIDKADYTPPPPSACPLQIYLSGSRPDPPGIEHCLLV